MISQKPLFKTPLYKSTAFVLSMFLVPAAGAGAEEVAVYKSPTCGCCGKWVDHMRENGFEIVVNDLDRADLDKIKSENKVPRPLGSCHTALVGGYVVEGHVPADAVQRLLKDKPAVKGIAVPGMPMGSPGMEGPTRNAYEVLTFDDQGKTTVFERR